MTVITNVHRETAIVVKRTTGKVHFVRMRAGALRVESAPAQVFGQNWQEVDYPLQKAIGRFLAHALKAGATQDAKDSLVSLQQSAGVLLEMT